MTSLHKLLFEIIHKMVIPHQERSTEANYLDLTLMEALDSEIKINLPSLMIQHMSRICNQDKKGHDMAYGFCIRDIFEHLSLPIKNKYVVSMLREELARKDLEIAKMITGHQDAILLIHGKYMIE
ncbi:hypothetical protein HAX54_002335 [Datura stramonium]|uniref:Uncharacterized protein n=1 Tax=Datura stramonium TaxID=4076 RepID=A0ABS8WV33_DATST|nr:hypothetical protein [Datura stramonium]